MYYTFIFGSIVASVANTYVGGSAILMLISATFLFIAALLLIQRLGKNKPFPRDSKGRFIKRK